VDFVATSGFRGFRFLGGPSRHYADAIHKARMNNPSIRTASVRSYKMLSMTVATQSQVYLRLLYIIF